MSFSPGARIGPSEVTAQIGVGGMGQVYRATDTNLKRPVAIKVLPVSVAADAERLARFQREAEVLASLNDSNIAQIDGLERPTVVTALVMELVEGLTLADRIAQGAIRLDEALANRDADRRGPRGGAPARHHSSRLDPANVKVRLDGSCASEKRNRKDSLRRRAYSINRPGLPFGGHAAINPFQQAGSRDVLGAVDTITDYRDWSSSSN